MALQLGDIAPDFEADTTEGRIKFHDWIGDSWAVLFSHPKDFTPVCTTELGYMASIEPEFEKRGVKIIGLSVDPLDKHEELGQGHRGDPGHGARTTRSSATPTSDLQGLRDAGRPTSPATPATAPRPTTRRSATSSSSAPTRKSNSSSSTR